MAPIQGITDYRFRSCFNKFFKGVDKFYAPYIRLEKGDKIPNARIRDLNPVNNQGINLIPQVMSNKVAELVFLANYLEGLGYKEMNWNLGCPYPMLTKRKLGSGLLPHPEIIDKLLSELLPKIRIKLSVKTRLGLEDPKEINKVITVLNKYPIEEIIIHPRIAKQLYKGVADRDVIEELIPKVIHPLAYNGDLKDSTDICDCQARFNGIDHWMIGRSIIANPFLAEGFEKNNISDESKIERFEKFHNTLVEEYLSALSGPSHLLNRMRAFWEYFSLSFSNRHKVFKRIKKANSIEKFYAAVATNFREESWEAE